MYVYTHIHIYTHVCQLVVCVSWFTYIKHDELPFSMKATANSAVSWARRPA